MKTSTCATTACDQKTLMVAGLIPAAFHRMISDRIVHRMAAVNQGSDEQHSSDEDDPDECPDGAEE